MQSATCPLRLTVFISFLVIQNFLQKEKLIFLWCILTSFVHVCSVPYCFIRCFNWSWYRVGDNPLNYSSSKLSLPSCRCLVPLTHFLIAAETKQGNLSNKYFPFFFHISYPTAPSGPKNLAPFFVRSQYTAIVNHLTPNGHYIGRTAQLTSRCCILYIYSTNIRTEYFKHAA